MSLIITELTAVLALQTCPVMATPHQVPGRTGTLYSCSAYPRLKAVQMFEVETLHMASHEHPTCCTRPTHSATTHGQLKISEAMANGQKKIYENR
jgi:hypothetical protein